MLHFNYIDFWIMKSAFLYEQAILTKSGAVVKSSAEAEIDNILFDRGINSKYDRPIPLSNGSYVKPDWYLVDYRIYVEYYGGKGNWEYAKSNQYKRAMYVKDRIRVIELWPEERHFLGRTLKRKFEQMLHIPFPEVEICQVCKGKMCSRLGKFGEFLGCSNFPNCRNTAKII